MTQLTRNEAAPQEPRITLRVDEYRVSGSGGCNRYSGEVRSGAPGQLTVGPLAGTRMACGEDIDRLENRFLTAFQSVTGYGFLAGKLALTYRNGDNVQTMLFEPR
jgi:heat shock protein HslJ